MKEAIYSGLFKRDVKRAEKCGKDIAALRNAIEVETTDYH